MKTAGPIKTTEKQKAKAGAGDPAVTAPAVEPAAVAAGLPRFLKSAGGSGAPPDDPFEREANRAADALLRGASPAPPAQGTAPARVQRHAQRGAPPHPNAAPRGGWAPGGGGQPLSPALRVSFEPHFGYDLGGVRVHTGAQAAARADAAGALAYTVGKNIVFNRAQYAPDTSAGRWVLAHEVAHVVQQDGGRPAGRAEGVALHAAPAGTVQRISLPSLSDVGDALGSAAETVGGGFVSGAEFVGGGIVAGAEAVGEGVEAAIEWTADQFMELVEEISPGLAELIRSGPDALITAALESGIGQWLSGLLAGLDPGAAIGGLIDGFGAAYELLAGVVQGEVGACELLTSAFDAVRSFGQWLAESPPVAALKAGWEVMKQVFGAIADFVLTPLFDALSAIAGTVFDAVKELAGVIWEWGGAVADALSAAWDWVMEQLGISGGEGGEGGIWAWLKEKAAAVWDAVKETLAPIIGPIKTVVQTLLVFSPVGPFLLAIRYLPDIVRSVQWLWAHRNDPDIIRSAHAEMGNTILPQVLESLQGFGQGVSGAAAGLLDGLQKIGGALGELVGGLAGVPVLGLLADVVGAVQAGVEALIAWATETVQAAAQAVVSLFQRVAAAVRPYIGVLTSIALAIVNPAMIVPILAGWAWMALPDCFKAPIIDFLLDIIIAFLEALPDLPMLGPLWSILRAGIVGFLVGMRAQSTTTKVFISNKMAKIIAGASPEFLIGFAKGLLQGLWEGLTDPFVLIYQAATGLVALVEWFGGMAAQALSPQPVAAAAAVPAGAPAPAPAPASAPAFAPASAEGEVDRAALGQRLGEMGAELQPPVEQVTTGFMPAVEEAMSSGGSPSFGQLVDKLGEAWAAIEAKIRELAGELVNKLVEFFMQDAAEGAMGESIGWLTGQIAFEVVLGILTAGSWTAAKGAMKVIKLFAKVLDWTSEALGVVFKALAKVGGLILEGLQGLRKLLSKAGGAAKSVIDALEEIGAKLVRWAGELLGFTGKRGAGEAAEAAGARGAREAAEATGARGAREAGQEAGGKAAEFPLALAEAKGIEAGFDTANAPVGLLLVSLNALQRRYRWIKRFEARPLPMPGRYAIFMIASETKVDEYSEGQPGAPAGSARGEEVFGELSDELALDLPGTGGSGSGVAAAIADARAAGLVGPGGSPGKVGAALQPHGAAPQVRGAQGITGAQAQSAHIGPTSGLRNVPGYSRSGADTILLDPATHKAFDDYWKNWAINRRRAGATQCTAAELYAVMVKAVDQTPGLPQQTKDALAFRLHKELFSDLNLQPGQLIDLPYRNIPPVVP